MQIFVALVLAAAPAGGRRVAVLDVDAKSGVTRDEADMFAEMLQRGLRDLGLVVIGRRDIEAMLSVEKMKDALGCDSAACLTEIGGALGVEEIVQGMLSREGKRVFVSLKRIDPAAARVLKHVARPVDGGLLDNAPRLASELYDASGAPALPLSAGVWNCAMLVPASQQRFNSTLTASAASSDRMTFSYVEHSLEPFNTQGDVRWDATRKLFVRSMMTPNGLDESTSSGWADGRLEWRGTFARWGKLTNLPYRQSYIKVNASEYSTSFEVMVNGAWNALVTGSCRSAS
jgi:hypothetical protein